MKRLKLMKIVSVCYRLKKEEIEHLDTSELEKMVKEWFAKANTEF